MRTQLSYAERQKIDSWTREGMSMRWISRQLGRSPGTIWNHVNAALGFQQKVRQQAQRGHIKAALRKAKYKRSPKHRGSVTSQEVLQQLNQISSAPVSDRTIRRVISETGWSKRRVVKRLPNSAADGTALELSQRLQRW